MGDLFDGASGRQSQCPDKAIKLFQLGDLAQNLSSAAYRDELELSLSLSLSLSVFLKCIRNIKPD